LAFLTVSLRPDVGSTARRHWWIATSRASTDPGPTTARATDRTPHLASGRRRSTAPSTASIASTEPALALQEVEHGVARPDPVRPRGRSCSSVCSSRPRYPGAAGMLAADSASATRGNGRASPREGCSLDELPSATPSCRPGSRRARSRKRRFSSMTSRHLRAVAGEPRACAVVAVGDQGAEEARSRMPPPNAYRWRPHREVGGVTHLEAVRRMCELFDRWPRGGPRGATRGAHSRSPVGSSRPSPWQCPDSTSPRSSARHRLSGEPIEDLRGVRGGIEDQGLGDASLDLGAEAARRRANGTRASRRLAVALASRSPRPARVMSSGAAAIVDVSAKTATGAVGGVARLHPPELHRGDARGVTVHGRGSRHADELTPHAARDVPGDVGDDAGADGDGRVGRRLPPSPRRRRDGARLVGEQAAALREAEATRPRMFASRQLVDDARSGGFLRCSRP
jgi:hypothetical protein